MNFFPGDRLPTWLRDARLARKESAVRTRECSATLGTPDVVSIGSEVIVDSRGAGDGGQPAGCGIRGLPEPRGDVSASLRPLRARIVAGARRLPESIAYEIACCNPLPE
jgi:hypothetical protein